MRNTTELEQLKTTLKSLKEKEKQAEKELKQNSRYQKIQKRHREINRRQTEIREEQEKLQVKAKKRILVSDYYPNAYPYYNRGSGWRGTDTNIRESVLLAIGKVAPLSNLKASQIEEIARKLFEKEERKYPKIGELEKEYQTLSDEQSKLWDEERKLQQELQSTKDQIYTIEQRIKEIQFQKEHPAKAKKQEEKEIARVDVFQKIDEIYKNLGVVEKEEGKRVRKEKVIGLPESELTVWNWLGITKDELDKRIKKNEGCAKCGKPTEERYTLCEGHGRAFTRWQHKQRKLRKGE